MRPIALLHNCTLAQLALAWLIAQPQTNAIAGARYVQQARDNALAAQLAEIDAIDVLLPTIWMIIIKLCGIGDNAVALAMLIYPRSLELS
ncbi:hypothetical protein [Nostoc sp. CALU 546]|uniref:hypothetical protein n=1 Tax=Nostoc sp. CALU 546 TaxID=1867241 RepID=UPI003B6712B4